MVFLRLNTTEANPNPHINFITPLKDFGPEQESRALKILRALAAQVRPVMKKHGLEINSFEEFEHNQVFLGRNWENGATVEVVLRRANGSFYSAPQLISVFCHELAHIMHMNHSPAFWKYYRELHAEVKALQRARYFGDGFWSSGQALQNEAQEEQEIESEDLPEYLCGGAHSQPAPKKGGLRKRRATNQAGSSNHSGAQTQKRRKAGTRVKGQDIFKGEGKALNADVDEETRKTLGTGFRKQAGSKRAREQRVAAIEARLSRLQGNTPEQGGGRESDEAEDEDEYEAVDETDTDRRQIMTDAMGDKELDSLKIQGQLTDFWGSTRKQKEKDNKKKKAPIDDSDATEDDSDDAAETLKKMGLSIEAEISGGAASPTSKAGTSMQRTGKTMSSAGHQIGAPTVPAGGEWACQKCTFINSKPLGLLCEVCGSERKDE